MIYGPFFKSIVPVFKREKNSIGTETRRVMNFKHVEVKSPVGM